MTENEEDWLKRFKRRYNVEEARPVRYRMMGKTSKKVIEAIRKGRTADLDLDA